MQDESRLGVVVLIVVVLAGFYFFRDGALNQAAPAFSLLETTGGRVDLESYRGRPVLLVFWMTSCSICRHELPLLNTMAPEFASKGIAVVAIHLGGMDEARDYMSSNHIDLTAVADSDGGVARAYQVSGVPKLVLVDKDGKVKRVANGWTSASVLRNWMDVVGGS